MKHSIALLVFALCLALLPPVVRAQPSGLPKDVQAEIDENKKACGATVKLGSKFIKQQDINADGVKDFILDYGEFDCDGSTTFFCGSAGCLMQVFASLPDGGYVKALDENVRSLKFGTVRGKPALILDLHGSACGKTGAARCPRTMVWDGKTFK
jgi:hypothetical protein